MLVEFEIEILLEHQITAHQFLMAKLIYQKKFELLAEYLESTESNLEVQKDLNNLAKAGFLTYAEGEYDFDNVNISDEFISLVTGDNIFEQLLAVYPTKVLRPDGTYDMLKTDLPMCRQIYARITQLRQIKHSHIMRCLEYEIEEKKATNTLGYMKRLIKWLSSEEWKSYEERTGDSSFPVRALEEDAYGTEFE